MSNTLIIQYNKISQFPLSTDFGTNSWFLKSEKLDLGEKYSSYKIAGQEIYNAFKDDVCKSDLNFPGNWLITGRAYQNSIYSSLSSAATIEWCNNNLLLQELQKLSAQLYGDNLKLPSYVGQVIVSKTLKTEIAVREIYGGERWQQIQGRFLLGTGPNEANTDTRYGNCSYGEMNVTSSRKTGGTNKVPLQIKNVPGHSHTIAGMNWKKLPRKTISMSLGASGGGEYGVVANGNEIAKVYQKHGDSYGGHNKFGGNYAGLDSVCSVNDVTGDGDITKSFTFTPKAESVSESGGNGSPHDNMPPYVAVYIWERIE